MPLLRIWKMLFGSAPPLPTTESPSKAMASKVAERESSKPSGKGAPGHQNSGALQNARDSTAKAKRNRGRDERRVRVVAEAMPGQPAIAANSGAVSKMGGLFSSGRRRGDPQLRKLLPASQVSKVLEIFVGDGSRTCSALETLAATQPLEHLSYAVIDHFEATPPPAEAHPGVSVKELHRRVRQIDAQVRVIPGSIESGLQRVAWTIGTVDLVLIGVKEEAWMNPIARERLRRVCHPQTTVLVHEGTKWRRFHENGSTSIRAAA